MGTTERDQSSLIERDAECASELPPESQNEADAGNSEESSDSLLLDRLIQQTREAVKLIT